MLSTLSLDIRVYTVGSSVVTALVKGDATNREYEDEKHSDCYDDPDHDVAVFSATHGGPDLSCTTAIGAALFDERVSSHLAYVDLLFSFDHLI